MHNTSGGRHAVDADGAALKAGKEDDQRCKAVQEDGLEAEQTGETGGEGRTSPKAFGKMEPSGGWAGGRGEYRTPLEVGKEPGSEDRTPLEVGQETSKEAGGQA